MMMVMKSKKIQLDKKIKQFKENTIELNNAIHNLTNNPPDPGFKLKYSKQLNSHLLFDCEIQACLEIWGTLESLNEQSIE